MTYEQIENLLATAKKHAAQETYAKGIIATWRKAENEQRYLSENFESIDCDEWLGRHAENEKTFKAVQMKVKHFFDMVYGKGNIFCANLKGRDCVEHYWAFEDFCRPIYPYIFN